MCVRFEHSHLLSWTLPSDGFDKHNTDGCAPSTDTQLPDSITTAPRELNRDNLNPRKPNGPPFNNTELMAHSQMRLGR